MSYVSIPERVKKAPSSKAGEGIKGGRARGHARTSVSPPGVALTKLLLKRNRVEVYSCN